MINGMLQLLLAKMNMSTVTSWFGGQPSDSGMNLLQQYVSFPCPSLFLLITSSRIISRVLNSDITELKKRLKAIDSSADRPTPEQTEALKAYISMSADQQAELRSKSGGSSPQCFLSSICPLYSLTRLETFNSRISHLPTRNHPLLPLPSPSRTRHHSPTLQPPSLLIPPPGCPRPATSNLYPLPYLRPR